MVKSDSSVISLVKESRLLTFSELNEGELEWIRSSLDQELDNINYVNNSISYPWIQDSRARNEDLEDRILSSVKKQENSIKSLETQVTELESEHKNNKSSSGGW